MCMDLPRCKRVKYKKRALRAYKVMCGDITPFQYLYLKRGKWEKSRQGPGFFACTSKRRVHREWGDYLHDTYAVLVRGVTRMDKRGYLNAQWIKLL